MDATAPTDECNMSTDASSTMHDRPYSLPGVNQVSPEDDWTGIEDPKEKKKLQNRVAQRVYRHRMKERIKMLQDRLEYHEARRNQNPNPNPAMVPSPLPNSSGVTGPGLVYPCPEIMPTVEAHQPHLCPTTEKPAPTQYDMLHMNQESLPTIMDCGDGNFFRGGLVPPEPLEASVTGIEGVEWSGDMSQDFMLKCLSLQSQLLDKFKMMREKTPVPDAQPQDDGRTAHIVTSAECLDGAATATAPAAMMTPAPSTNVAFSPANKDDIFFEFDPLADNLTSDGTFFNAHHYQQDSTTRSQRGLPETPSSVSSSANKAAENGYSTGDRGSPSTLPRGAPMDERLGSVMEQAEAAGFASFDELVMAYYGEQLGESSPLANEQRLSRNRRLPRVVSDVFNRASEWSAWERRGFYEEILKIAETMLTVEGAAVRTALVNDVQPLMEGGDRDKVCLRIRRMVQDLVPNLWALNSALVANDGDWRQRDRSNAALASILLMHCAGRMPKDQLLRLLELCL